VNNIVEAATPYVVGEHPRKPIATMRQTGADHAVEYKETSLGGLAVNFVEC
jgi:hypothetical protein